MLLEDEFSWMNIIRRIRFYLPSGQFYDTDFDPEMGMKEIKKIIGLIASIKQPFTLFYENTKLPDTDNKTLNSIFKNKSFDEIIVLNVQINSKDTNSRINKNSKFKNKGSNNQVEKIISNNKINSILEKEEKDQKKINLQKGKTNAQVIESSFINGGNNLKEKDKELLSIFKNYKSQIANSSNNNLNGGFQAQYSIDNINKEDKKNKIKIKDKNKEDQIKLSGIIKKK